MNYPSQYPPYFVPQYEPPMVYYPRPQFTPQIINNYGLNLPCNSLPQWDYNNDCFSFYKDGCYNECRFVNMCDIEDFMNNEKRKEKSRDAARCRRSRETEIFTDLASALPLSKESAAQLDKASIMRLAISFLRVRDMITLLPEIPQPEDTIKDESVFLEALEGFLLVVSSEGDLVFLSENVHEYLGITQIDLMGQNIYDYSHPCDHEEIKEILTSKVVKKPKSFFIRLKCTLTSKGRSVNLKSATYKVIHCTGHIIDRPDIKTNLNLNNNNNIKCKKNGGSSDADADKASNPNAIVDKCLVAVGQPIPHPSNIEIPLDKKTFLTKHSLDMKFTYADDKMLEVLGYDSEDLVGQSVYGYHHAMDSDTVCSDFKSLFSKGQCETGQYRFLAKTGGYVWVVTQATLIHDKLQKPQSVVCVNYVISGIECKDEIYSSAQLSSVKSEIDSVVCSPEPLQIQEISITSTNSTCSSSSTTTSTPQVSPQLLPEISEITEISEIPELPEPVSVEILDIHRPLTVTSKLFSPIFEAAAPSVPRPQTATSKIFAPRTEEMNKGFLMFSDEEPGLTVMKDEPDDLTHLAPTAGDVCIPLEDSPLISDMLNDFLGENYCPLFTDDLHSLDSECSKTSDPFISYQDEYDDNHSTTSPHLLSPTLSSKSLDCTIGSLNSPGNSLGEDEHMNTFISLQMDEDEPDLSTKAPYIPMNGGDDFPLLSNDLMWTAIPNQKNHNNNNNNLNHLNNNKNHININNKTSILNTSSLANLLCTSVTKTTIKPNDHGGGITNTNTNRNIHLNYTNRSKYNKNQVEKNELFYSYNIMFLLDTDWNVNVNVNRQKVINENENGRHISHANKRMCNSAYDPATKRSKNEPKEKLSSELLQQLISNNNSSNQRQRTRSKNGGWLLDTGSVTGAGIGKRVGGLTGIGIGKNQAACVSQPSDSVLMNLLVSGFDIRAGYICLTPTPIPTPTITKS